MAGRKSVLLIFPACDTKTFGSNESIGIRKEKTLAPPLGILYLAAELMDAGYRVEACDFNAEDFSEKRLREYAGNADIAGISMMSFNREHAARIISFLNLHFPALPVIAGGPDSILHPRLVPGTELTVCHEAESIIVPIVETVLTQGDYSRLPGVYYRDGRGLVCQGARCPCRDDLDRIKFPRRELFRDNKGYSVIGKKTSRAVTTIITSRGCPRQCRFCAHNAVAYSRYRERSAENVLAEFELIAAQGYRVVGIADDNFTANRARAQKILHGIIDRKLKFTLFAQGRADAADYDLFCLMKRAGVKVIAFGLESGNQDVLDFYNKGTTVEQNRRAVCLADKAGLYTGGLFILGAPFETREHFDRTYRFAASLPLDITSFWVLDYTYGSALWGDAHARGQIRDDEFNVPAGKERGTSPYPTEEIEHITQKFFFSYYARPTYWLRQAHKVIRVRSWYFIRVMTIGSVWLIVRKLQLSLEYVKARASEMRLKIGAACREATRRFGGYAREMKSAGT